MTGSFSLKILLLLCLTAATSCGPPPEADFGPSVPAETLTRPELTPTSRFDGLVAQASPDRDRLQDETDALAARAAGLRERAAAMNATPMIDDAERTRLMEGLESGVELPDES